MVIVETMTIGTKQYIHTYSDSGKYVVRDGVEYEEAYDLAELGRVYTEGDDIPVTNEEILQILMGETA